MVRDILNVNFQKISFFASSLTFFKPSTWSGLLSKPTGLSIDLET